MSSMFFSDCWSHTVYCLADSMDQTGTCSQMAVDGVSASVWLGHNGENAHLAAAHTQDRRSEFSARLILAGKCDSRTTRWCWLLIHQRQIVFLHQSERRNSGCDVGGKRCNQQLVFLVASDNHWQNIKDFRFVPKVGRFILWNSSSLWEHLRGCVPAPVSSSGPPHNPPQH